MGNYVASRVKRQLPSLTKAVDRDGAGFNIEARHSSGCIYHGIGDLSDIGHTGAVKAEL